MRIAIVYNGIDDITGGGGAERFFADFFDIYNAQPSPTFKMFFLSDSVDTFQKQGKLKSHLHNVVRLNKWSNRFKSLLEGLNFALLVLVKRIRLVHFANYQFFEDYHKIAALNALPRFIRPKIVINIVDCRLAHQLADIDNRSRSSYFKLFQTQRIDAIYSWYELFKEHFDKAPIFNHTPYIESIVSFYVDTQKFTPANSKQNNIVFASRLVPYKNPVFFLEGISILYKKSPQLFTSWKVLIYGKGELLEVLQKKVVDRGLQNLVSFGSDPDMAGIFNTSKCFVSTQEMENFTSLSMMEAMAAGNTIISRDVGQSYSLVKNNINGYLLQQDTPEGLADSLEKYLLNSSLHQKFQEESTKIIKEVHTAENFIKQTNGFWRKVLDL